MVAEVRAKSGLIQWKNSYELLTFFNSLPNKSKSYFTSFDICAFYPAITEDLLRKSINHVEKYTNITEEEKEILFHTSKFLLFHNGEAWVKKGRSLFDVGMGGYDGAEKCDLVGLYLLSLLRHLKLIMGLFRDDGLAISTQTPRQNEQMKKQICKIFKDEGLDITIQKNLKVVEFLDVELNPSTGTHRPFNKPNNTILYVDANSNHPNDIKKNIPLAVQKRLSLLSSNEQIFMQAAPPYQEALDKAGYKKHQLNYDTEAKSNNGKHTRSKRATWFNPPFSQSVKTNVGAEFLKIVSLSVPKGHPLNKYFNRNTIKVSYRTTSNVSQVISRHNKKLLNQTKQVNSDIEPKCNCLKQNLPCIMGGTCKPGNVVYQGRVTRQDTGHTDTYTCLSEPSWKLRWGNHKHNINTESERNATCLSKHIWDLKDKHINYSLSFNQLSIAPA